MRTFGIIVHVVFCLILVACVGINYVCGWYFSAGLGVVGFVFLVYRLYHFIHMDVNGAR